MLFVEKLMQKSKENLNGVESSMVQCYMKKDEKIDATRKKIIFNVDEKTHCYLIGIHGGNLSSRR